MVQIIQVDAKELQTIVKRCFLESISEVRSLSAKQEPPDRISIDEVIELTGLRKSVVYKKSCENTIPKSKFGKRLVFSRKAILEWMESCTIRPIDINTVMSTHLSKQANKKR